MYFGRVWITQKEGREDLVRPEQIEPRKLKDRQRKQTGKDIKMENGNYACKATKLQFT
jgi:hypothetical protein